MKYIVIITHVPCAYYHIYLYISLFEHINFVTVNEKNNNICLNSITFPMSPFALREWYHAGGLNGDRFPILLFKVYLTYCKILLVVANPLESIGKLSTD